MDATCRLSESGNLETDKQTLPSQISVGGHNSSGMVSIATPSLPVITTTRASSPAMQAREYPASTHRTAAHIFSPSCDSLAGWGDVVIDIAHSWPEKGKQWGLY